MILKAFLVALVYYVSIFTSIGMGLFHFNRPIVVGPLVGLLLGDLTTGIILGATFESVFLGVIAIGGSVPADATVGTIVGTAIAIIVGVDANSALAIAVPVSMLGVVLGQVTTSILVPLFIPVMDKTAEKGDVAGLKKWHFLMTLLFPLLTAIAIFLAIWLGSNSIGAFLDQIPSFVTGGFQAAGAMLPAVGFALLLNMLFDKKVFAFFFLGFVMVIYLHLPSLAIAIIATVFAITQYYRSEQLKIQFANNFATATVQNEEEAFFNE
ncbi:PTS mannose/fructose/sorbose/N-acetylgalactosamine transporter subunit IIC [Fusibacter ferrireducens]|uniref:PTS sugar transporter subunit IIC n=1 Tax=Fusibacter ferrireducens TaxID=2785058 RepID=A0ABR9ZRG5_9FIRM|nr:PTS sugar transporter subunit IIC [Fusibacter ferrireducens]MBF4692520.1 PTS sugar transporter subunit IIC [Fusibacter ferrireducens]